MHSKSFTSLFQTLKLGGSWNFAHLADFDAYLLQRLCRTCTSNFTPAAGPISNKTPNAEGVATSFALDDMPC